MRRVKLDRIDRRILRDLQDDGRMTNVELAHPASGGFGLWRMPGSFAATTQTFRLSILALP